MLFPVSSESLAVWCNVLVMLCDARLNARRAYARQWQERNRERRTAQQGERRRANPEAHRASARRSYWKHVERKRADARAWNAAHRDQRRAYNQTYTARHRERLTQQAAVRRAKNRDRYRDLALRRNYGITLDDYQRMLAAQGGGCGICGRRRGQGKGGSVRLHVDHDHATGRPRGLLCGTCNRGIGQLGDDLQRVRAAVRYLERHRQMEAPPPQGLFAEVTGLQ